EDLRADPRALLKEVGAFLGMDLAPFDEMEIVGAYNYYTDPRTDWAWKVVQQEGIRQILRSAIPPRARRWLWNRVLLKPGKKPDPDPQAVGFLKDFYAPQVKTLEALLGRSLPELRQGW
ncbi:MAG TPA: sulfotransferase, partial [Gammaproteobacteria bacterium]|nr:sulfotransferase [Gammaproteobacteria bacterium]